MSKPLTNSSFAAQLRIAEFDYPLTENRIAQYPLEARDQSKLLIVRQNTISEDHFYNIGGYIPPSSLLVRNETKVINARLHFRKQSGALIELFCLEPAATMGDIQQAFARCGNVNWNCLVGNSRRWKEGILEQSIEIEGKSLLLRAERIRQYESYSEILFSWNDDGISFARLIELAGEIPLPPYVNREAEAIDSIRYQTVYAQNEGSVAAPTAGLHFTDELIQSLEENKLEFAKLSLHVGAGTFKPVSSKFVGDHSMHTEQIIVSRATIEKLIQHQNKVIAIGTTSLRSLESIYWLGMQLHKGKDARHIDQWEPYLSDKAEALEPKVALKLLLEHMDKHGLNELHASTAMMILPGYDFRISQGLITNFHQPKSTLLLLVAALIGDQWKQAYAYALEKDFRFLSYGDSCLFLP